MKVLLSDLEYDHMVAIEDWIKPPLPYPVWSLNREEKYILIYDNERYVEVCTKYFNETFIKDEHKE